MLPPTTLRSVLSCLKPMFTGKKSLAVLSTVKVQRTERSFTLTATSLDTYVTFQETTEAPQPNTLRYFLDAARVKKEPPTEACLDYTMLAELAKLADPRGTITLLPEKDCHTLSCRSVTGAELQRRGGDIAPDDFPSTPTAEVDFTGTFPDLAGRIDRIRAFISTDHTRYVLNGIFLDSHGHVVATDGRKLGLCAASEPWAAWSDLRANQQGCENRPREVVLPTEACTLIPKLFPAGVPLKVEVLKLGQWARISHGNWTLHTKLIDGNYPNYRQVLPNLEQDVRRRLPLTSVATEFLLKALRAMQPATTCVFHQNKLVGSQGPSWGLIQLKGEKGDGEQLQTLGLNDWLTPDQIAAMQASAILAPDMNFKLAVRTGFLRDVMESTHGAATFHFTGMANNPGPLVVTSPDGYTAVLMPIRLNA